MLNKGKHWLALAGLLLVGVAPAAAGQCPHFLDHTSATLLHGKAMPLCQYVGRVNLVVNTAGCGDLTSRDGTEVVAFGRLTKPDDTELRDKIGAVLEAKGD